MNPNSPKTPREELEARLTALLLGELSAEEAAAVREAIAQDAELARLHERLKQTIGLVRETVTSPADGLSAKPDALKLSTERREKLLQHFKTKPVATREPIVPRRRWQIPWFVPMSAAAVLIATVAGLAFLPPMLRRVALLEYVGEPEPLAEGNDFESRKIPPRLTMIPGKVAGDTDLAINRRDALMAPAPPAQKRDSDTDGAVADESRRKTHWFAAAGNPESAPPPPPTEPTLAPAPALPAESKPQVLSVVVLPQPATEAAQATVNFETRHASAADDHLARFGDVSRADVGQGIAPQASYGGFAGGGGGAGGTGGAAGRTEFGGERLLSRGERLSEARENLGRAFESELAPLPLKIPAPTTKGMPEELPATDPHRESLEETLRTRGGALVVDRGEQRARTLAAPAPAAPPVQSPAGTELAYRGTAVASGPAPAESPAPARGRRSVAASRALSEPLSTEGVVANGIEPVNAGVLTMTAADPVSRVELKDLNYLDASSPRAGLKLAAAFEAKNEPVELQKKLADRNEPAGAVEAERLGVVAGKPVVVAVNGSSLTAKAGSGNLALGDTPAIGQLFEKQRGFFDTGVVAPAKTESGSGLGAKANESSFGLNMAKGGDEVALRQSVDSIAANIIGRQDFFADSFGVTDLSAREQTVNARERMVKDAIKNADTAWQEGPSRSGGGRDGASVSSANTWDFALGIDARAKAADKKASGVEAKSKVDVTKEAAVLAGGDYSVNAVGYVNVAMITNATIFGIIGEPVSPDANFAISDLNRRQSQAEPEIRRRAEIVLPKLQVEEGRPVGERSAGRYLASNARAAESKSSVLRRKLDSIRLNEFSSDSLPLAQVVEAINREARTQDPDKNGINILLSENRNSTVDGKQPVEPMTGLPVSAPTDGANDLNAVTVKLPMMRNVTLGEALDAIAKAADRPLKFDLQNNGVVISAKQDTAKEVAKEDVATHRPAPTAPIPQPEVRTAENAFSTFSLNVSDVSFKLAAASLEKGAMPDVSTVRSEEFINAFDYRDPEPTGAPIAFAWERARYPFAQNRDLLRLSVKTAAAGRQPGQPLNLVLLLDNSGSMERADRVRIIQQCLRVLAGQLRPEDRISVVTFARTPRLWVDGLAGNQAAQVAEQVGGLTPQGGTNLEEAMNLAYQTARRHYLANGINRVVLLTDGAANLGDLQPESLKKKVESFRKQGIALDCFGIGWDGYNDDLLEVLSRNGDGRYGFVNTPEAAYVEFAGQLAGALKVAASDVKVQVEFNPKRVIAYRQIGYAKHQLTKQQFRDNTVDAAEIAAQEAGNALYTIETNPGGEGPIATVRVRYKIPGTTDYREQAWDVPYAGNAIALEQASSAMRLAATTSAFSEWLASSPFAQEVTPDQLLNYLSSVPEIYGADARPKKLEWMIRQAKSVAGK